MQFRPNLGCLWLLLAIALLGGTPLLVGILRVFAGFVLIALAGGALLNWWLRRHAAGEYLRTRGPRARRFVELLVALLVRLAETDGALDRREVTAIRHFFQHRLGYRGERLLWIRDLIKESRRHPKSVTQLCRELRENYGLQERLIVLQVLARVAEADGAITPKEARFIEHVAEQLGLAAFFGAFGFAGFEDAGPGAGAAGRRPSQSERVERALAELGLKPGASAAEIKAAWRKLSLENHPDRVAHLGEEFRKLAEERMRRINAAYDELKQAGMAA